MSATCVTECLLKENEMPWYQIMPCPYPSLGKWYLKRVEPTETPYKFNIEWLVEAKTLEDCINYLHENVLGLQVQQ
mgnify:CR=1 FL=1